ncbi:MAG: S8 family serine peptidase [Anaerolineae bacterium]
MSQRSSKLLVVLIAVSLVLLLGAGGALLALRGRATPTPSATPAFGTPPAVLQVTPPASVEELATRYPQLGSLLLDESLSSVYKEFMVAFQTGGVDGARELAEKRGLLNDQDQVTITLVVDSPEHTAAVAEELQGFGVIVLGSYDDLIDIAVPMALVERFASAEQAGAMFAQLSQLEHVVKLRLPIGTQMGRALYEAEGPGVTGADVWHDAGFRGQGVKVGVLDLGFDGYRDLLGTALPETVVAESFSVGQEPDQSGEVHGTACAEIVHAMAPDAELYLAYYSGSTASESRAVDWLLSQGVDVITHSASSLAAPMDGTGPDVEIVNRAAKQGVVWVNSSGNYADSHYRGDFTDSDGDGVHEFVGGRESMGYAAPAGESVVILNWSDWEAADQDYDLFLVDEDGSLIASSEDSQRGRQGDEPIEGIIVNLDRDEILYVVIQAAGADRAVRFDLYAPDGAVEYPEPAYSLGSPADASAALTVGAVYWQSGELEEFSSQGPTNDGRLKPDISGPDATSTESYAHEAFYGTSASTPHVAGAAALVLSAYPDFTPQQVSEFLMSNAIDRGPGGPDNGYGYGSLNLPAPGTAPTPASGEPLAEATPVTEPTGASGSLGGATPTAIALAEPSTPEPRSTAAPRAESNSGTLLLLLGGMVCLGTIGLLGGVILLVLLTRRGRKQQAQPPQFQASQYRPPQYQPPQHPPQRQEPSVRPQIIERPDEPSATAGPAHLEGVVGKRFVLRQGDNHVGRAPDNEIALHEDSSVSRRHAVIRCHTTGCSITDLDSSNGTWLNGQRLQPQGSYPLNHDDTMSFGPDSQFVYKAASGH